MNMDQTNDTRYRAAYLGALLARHYPDAAPHMIGRVVFDMQTAARSAVSWETKRCNVSMTERQEEAGAKRIEKLQDAVNAALAEIAAISPRPGKDWLSTVDLGGDPRGPCARLHVPGERGDGFGDGFAIY